MGRSSSSSTTTTTTTTTTTRRRRRRRRSSSSNLSVASILLLFLALSFLLLFPGFLLEAQAMVEPQRNHAGGHHGSNVGHHGINKGHHAHRSGSAAAPGTGLRQSQCPGACAYRCSKAFTNKACKFFCNKCCNKCLCVPPGTYGNKEVCPCYNNWKTQQGGPKCP